MDPFEVQMSIRFFLKLNILQSDFANIRSGSYSGHIVMWVYLHPHGLAQMIDLDLQTLH